MIYYMDHIQIIQEEDLHEFLPFLSPQRRGAMCRYRFAKDRICSALGYLLLRYGLIKDYGIFEIPRIDTSEKGKPFLPDYPGIHFNLSHCKKAVACGFGNNALGVDVQHTVPYKESMARRFMTPEEKDEVLLGDRDQGFTRLWTRKESYGKCLGTGIGYSMSEISLIHGRSPEGHFISSLYQDGCWMSVCGWEEQELQEITFSQLYDFYTKLPIIGGSIV